MTSPQVGQDAADRSAGELPGPAGLSTAAGSGDTAVPDDGAMIRSEERLLISTELVESGRVRVTKFIVTQDVTLTVQLRREQVRLEWLPAGEPGTAGTTAPREAVRPEAFELVLHAEQPVVTKEIVPVERVRLATRIVAENVTVTETLRKEQISDPGIETMGGQAGDA